MGKQSEAKGEEPYKKTTAIVASGVAVLSLLSTLGLGIANLRLSGEKAVVDQQLSKQTIELNDLKKEADRQDIKLKAAQAEILALDLKVKRRSLSVDLYGSYPFVSGIGIFRATSEENRKGFVMNGVWKDLQPWLEDWSIGGSLMEGEGGSKQVHGLLLFKIENRSTQVAQDVMLTVRSKEFPASGKPDVEPWELDRSKWRESTISLKDIPPGGSKVVPVAHMLGTDKYFGRVVLPQTLTWNNPTTAEKSKVSVATLVASDQWQVESANVQLAQ